MPIKKIITKGKAPVKIFTDDVEHSAYQQLCNISQLPFIHSHVAAMPDVHFGKGATVGSVIPCKGAIIPPSLETAYATLTEDLLIAVRTCFERAGGVTHLRLHGANHPGNILCRDETLHIVDFDDARMGPAIQDLWMFLSGDREYMSKGLADVLNSYTQFRDFNPAELNLIEALRALRQMHFSAWLARRWNNPAFPKAFPWFDTPRYWENHILELREQLAAMQEHPLTWMDLGVINGAGT